MPDEGFSLKWREQALNLEARLRKLTGQAPERLDEQTINRCYPRRSWVAGWRVNVSFSDNIVRRIDVLASIAFPSIPVRTALVDHPEFMTWPHVESDGILCLLPNMAECDPDDPSAVAENLLGRSIRLVEELLEGSIIERDFREEFLTYWAYKAHSDGARFFSLLVPEPPSRVVQVWKGNGIEVVGEDVESLTRWVQHRFGANAKTKTEKAAFLWLPQAPLPTDYTETASELYALATAIGADAVAALEQAALDEPDDVVAVLGATGRRGSGLIGVRVPNPKRMRHHSRSVAVPVSKGFRSRKTAPSVLLNRYFGSGPVIRTGVQRADANWVHGRGQDSRTEHLLGTTVVLFGCGSVGAPVAGTLAQAGIGKIILVDPDILSWPNVSRHPLGASAVGRNKAQALAERLQVDFPHLHVEGRACGLHEVIRTDADLLNDAHLIIAATGSWSAESALNHWHVGQGRHYPILYGWTEAHACAGHAVVVRGEGGCLQCHIGRTGSPSFRVVAWPDGGDAGQEEPACGAHYQPYGPVELNHVTTMISDLALDCLLDPPPSSFSRVFATSQRRLDALGGRWSDEWLAEQGHGDLGVRTLDRPWPPMACAACGIQTASKTA